MLVLFEILKTNIIKHILDILLLATYILMICFCIDVMYVIDLQLFHTASVILVVGDLFLGQH